MRKPSITSHVEPNGALSEREATQLGHILASQFGAPVPVEQLTAQRLRLGLAFEPRRRTTAWWRPTHVLREVGALLAARMSAVTLGAVASVLVVGIGVGIGNYRSTLTWQPSQSVGLSPEPLRVATHDDGEPPVAKTADGDVDAPKGKWRSRGRGVLQVDAWLQAENEALQLDWEQEGESARQGNSSAKRSVRLEPGARARVLSVGDDGLVLSLEHGRIVVRGAGSAESTANAASCEVFAGPYRVRSSDASYELSWSTATHDLALRMHEGQALFEENLEQERLADGRVAKAAPTDEHAVPRRQIVSAGQRVLLGGAHRDGNRRSKDAAKGVRDVREPAAAKEHAAKERTVKENGLAAVTKQRQEELASQKAVAAAPAPVAVDNQRWKALAESGQYREAVAAAKVAGFEAVQARASASDLLLLADAARLGGAPSQARATLTLLRQNFPSHANAAIAAFTLGRMAQELDHNDRAALKWYRTYLHQEPKGRMAEGARARILKGALRVGTTEEVQAAARDYLAHHPSGSSAALARQSL